MSILSDKKKGILLQGKITEWTLDIISEYVNNFPSHEILFSTWTTEKTNDIECEVLKIEPPPKREQMAEYTVNHQILGTRAGLKKLQCDIVMKCRTDQFIHNSEIFKIFETSCDPQKIMVPNNGIQHSIDFYISDFCQVASKSLLEQYWNNMPIFSGNFLNVSPEIYLTKNYVQKIKHDLSPWKSIIDNYFCVKSFHLDFQIEWEKLIKSELYRKDYPEFYFQDLNFKSMK